MRRFQKILISSAALIVLLLTAGLIVQFRPGEMSQLLAGADQGSRTALLSTPAILDDTAKD